MKNFYKVIGAFRLLGGVVTLLFVLSSWVTPEKISIENNKTRILYTAQVTGFPVQDEVIYEYDYSPKGEVVLNQFLRRDDYNSYEASYSHTGQVELDGSIAFKIGYVLHPNDFKGTENTKAYQFGDQFTYPANWQDNIVLNDIKGKVNVSNDRDYSKVIDISITNRKVLHKETLRVGTKSYPAFKLTYQVNIEKYFNDQWFESRQNDVQEWYVPNLGVIRKQENASVSVGIQGSEELRSYNTEFVMSATDITQD